MDQSTRQLPVPNSILALEQLRDLAEIRQRFESTFGFELDNLSHWNPKSEFGQELQSLVRFDGNVSDLSAYVYPYDLNDHKRAIARLENVPNRCCIFTSSGTTSIVNAIAYCANAGIQGLAVIRPAYFAVEELARTMGVDTQFFDLSRCAGLYELPDVDHVIKSGCNAVWLTSPVYCAGAYFDSGIIAAWVRAASDRNLTVFIDESFAQPQESIVRELDDSSRAIAIYVPHKSVSLNGFRVSILTFPDQLREPFEQWSDAFSGGLPTSTLRALSHFLSDSFDHAELAFSEIVASVEHRFEQLAQQFPSCELDQAPTGHLRQLYFPKLDPELQKDTSFLENVFFECACGFIPGRRFAFPDSMGFSFRVNLLRLDEGGFGGLYRVLSKLSSEA